MGWNSQKMTRKQREAAHALFATWREEGIGQQPYAVISSKGVVEYSDQRAVCLGGLYHSYHRRRASKDGGLILFQMVVRESDDKEGGFNKLAHTDETIRKYVEWVVHDPIVQPFICKHTKKDREVFVPIALENTPTNAPLFASTWVRWMWDRHNNHHSRNVPVIKALCPRWTMKQLFIAANCLSDLTKKDTIHLGMQSSGHAAFSDASFKAVTDIYKGCFDLGAFDLTLFDYTLPSRGLGIEEMFNNYYKEKSFSTVLREEAKGIAKHNHRFGGECYSFDKLPRLLKIIDKVLKEK